MIRPRAARLQANFGPFLARAWPVLLLPLLFVVGAPAQEAGAPGDGTPGQFFTITEPITHDTLARVRAATRQLVDRNASAEQGTRPILVFEFLSGESAPGASEFGACYDLANLISKELAGARLTVAYVPQPVRGYAVLPAIACTEIVMGSSASLGPITPENLSADAALREPVRFLAMRKTRDPDLLLGMLDRDADLRLVHTADKTVHYVLADNMKAFRQTHEVADDKPAWEGGQRGVLTAARAREEGFCKRTADSPAELASIYQIGGQSAVDDPTLGQAIRPAWIKIDGPLDARLVFYLTRSLEQARQEKVNLLILEINSTGGMETEGDNLADLVSSIKDMKTVAYIDDRATGVAALLPLACRDIVFSKKARMGDVRQVIGGGGGHLVDLTELMRSSLAKKAAMLARQKGHPEAVALAMVDPDIEVIEAKDSKTGAARLITRSELEAENGRFQALQTRKEAGTLLTVRADDATSYGLGQMVADDDELKGLYGLRGRAIRVDGPGWVDSLVTILTDPYVSWLLLFIGAFMLVIELKLPGIGLPAIISALAFLLFFWSHYLSGTADQLEIILFLIGLVSLAVEIFVFPGFGVFGMSGILLMLCSIVLASHTFIWPTQDYEYQELGHTLLQVTGMLVAVGGCAVVLARYFPSLPFFNRLVLKPEPWTRVEPEDSLGRPIAEGYESLAFLVGETGRTTSPLRPTGKAQFGGLVIDVTADRAFVETDSLVEVVDVQGPRVIVKRVGA
jgi:membrane-bound serine protease (ClpP class)